MSDLPGFRGDFYGGEIDRLEMILGIGQGDHCDVYVKLGGAWERFETGTGYREKVEDDFGCLRGLRSGGLN